MIFLNEAPAANDNPLAPAPPARRPLVEPLPPPRPMTFEEMVSRAELEEKDVEIDGWGWVRIRQIAQVEFEQMIKDTRHKLEDGTWGTSETDQGKIMVQLCLVAPRVTRAQVDLLWTKAQDCVQRLLTEIAKLNRIGAFTDLKTGQQSKQVIPESAATFRGERDATV